MKRFISQILGFVILQAGLLGVLLHFYNVEGETNYLAATVDKHDRLRKMAGPRIVLVGGSNVAFGFESDRIEKAMGRPVANMGLAAGLGIEFMLREIEPALGDGDLVVLSLEYDHFARGPSAERFSGLGFDPNVLEQMLVFRPESCRALGWVHARKIVLDRGLAIAGEIVRRGLLGVKSPSGEEGKQSARAGFNSWGDLVGHRREPARTTPEVVNKLPLVADARSFPNSGALAAIEGFVDRAGRRGVRVVFSFTPKPVRTIERENELAERLAEALRRIPGLTVLDSPRDHAYPPEQFFDTANHLTAAGAAERTRRLIEALERHERITTSRP